MKAGEILENCILKTLKKNLEPVARRLWILLSKRVILLPVYRFCMDFIRGIMIIFNLIDSANRLLCKRLLIFNLFPRVLSYRSRPVGEYPGNDTACLVLKRQRKLLMFNNNTYCMILSIIFLSVCTLILSSLIVHA